MKTNAQSRTALQPTTGNTTLTYKLIYGGRMVTMAGVYKKKSKAQQVVMKFFQYENMIRFQICIKIKGLIFVRLMTQKYFLTRNTSIWEREGKANPLKDFFK